MKVNLHTPINETASQSRDRTVGSSRDSRESGERGEDSSEIRRRYQNASLSEVSSPSYWQQIHHFGSSIEGESLSDAGEGRFNAFENDETYGGNNEPEGEPHNRSIVGRLTTGRTPAIYP